MGYSYQNDGSNVNLTGSPDYAARVRIVGDAGSGCSSNQYAQFNAAAFAGPLPGSVSMQSGRNYLANGELNSSRVTPRTAGFGAATSAAALRSVPLQLRLQF